MRFFQSRSANKLSQGAGERQARGEREIDKYCAAGGDREVHGIQAIARAFEHINFAWAFCGWMLRLPLIGWVAELITEAVSPAPPKLCRVNVPAAGSAS